MNRLALFTALRPRVLVMGISLALGLAACGGGGGASNVRPTPTSPPPSTPPPSTPPPSAPPPSTPPPSTDQPATDAHLVLTNANAAHDAGFTGTGVIIGVVDTGINRNHPALKGRVLDELIYVDTKNNDLSKDDVVGHGTWVSQIAAGQPFGKWPGGIAPDASLVSARIISDTPPKDDGSGSGNKVEAADADFFGTYLLPDLIKDKVQIMNNSWGGLYFDPANVDTVAAAFAKAFRPFVVDHGGIVVFATGNESKADPSDTTSLPYWAPDLEKGWIAAAALDSLHPDQLASYSNQCGRSMNYCLSAPGDVVVTGADDTSLSNIDYYVVSGTSFATPEVSGAAADVWQAFPYFNNDLVRQTLLGTAKDLGAPGVDPVFGWGALDVGKAVKGPANFAWGDVSVKFDGITSTWSNDIVGDGGLIKNGTGTLVLAGTDSYKGDTQLMGGTLQAANTLPGNVSVGASGHLDSVPGVKGNLDNSGEIIVKGGDNAVSGNYTQASSGILSINLGSELKVTGSASLAGNLNVIGKDEGYVTNDHQDVLTTGKGLTGTFAKLTTASGVFLSTTIEYDANDVWLDTTSLTISAAAQSEGINLTPASASAAQRVQGTFDQIDAHIAAGDTSGISSQFLSAAGAIQHTPTAAAAEASLRSLSGQLHAASAAMTFQAIDASSQALSQHFDTLLDNPLSVGMWTHRLNVGGAMGGGVDGVGFQLNGWLAGSDQRIGHNGVVGFAFGQSSGQQRLDQSVDRSQDRSTEGMLYGGWISGQFYTQGRVGFGHYQQNVNRQLLLGNSWQGVETDYNGRYNVAYAESGLHFSNGPAQLTPFADVQYARINRDGFAEQGAGGFGLRSDAQTVSRWQAGLGLRAAHHWQLDQVRSLDLTARAQWQHTLAQRGDVFEASFVGLQQWQPLAGVGLSRDSALFGIGLNAVLSRNTALNFAYDYQTGQHDHAQTLSATLNVAF